MKSGQFLSVTSAVRVPRRDDRSSTSSTKLGHPGYSLFEWKKLSESLPVHTHEPWQIDLMDLSKHSTEDDCWTAIRGKVYNVTKFLKYHPGRKAQLMRGAGIDSTRLYDKVHSWVNEEAILQKCFIGYLTSGDEPAFNKFIVHTVEAVSHDTKLFLLEKMPSTNIRVPAGQYVRLRALIKGETVVREYTPIVNPVDKDSKHLMLMIKIYSHGKMTQYLSTIHAGDSLFISGASGSFCAETVCSVQTLVLIAAGTGLTPMTSLLNTRYHQNKEHQSTLLLFANKSEKDILWRDKLEEVCRSPQFQVVNILSLPSSCWNGATGKISLSFLERHLPQPCDDVKVCISGPILFSRAMSEYLMQLKYPNEAVHCFD